MRLFARFHLAQIGMALSAVAFVLVDSELLGRVLPLRVYAAAFFGTWAIYLWDARDSFSEEDEINQPRRAAFFREYRRLVRWLAPSSLALTTLLLWSYRDLPHAVPVLAALGLCGLAYVFPLLPRPGRSFARVKDIPFLKMLVISTAWAGGGVGVPLLLGRATGAPPVALPALLLFPFALLSLDTFALNYRDRRGDAAARLTTLVHVAGERALRLLQSGAWACVLLAAILFSGRARLVECAMAISFALVTLAIPRLEKDEILYSMAVGGWRFVGALACLGWYGQ